MSEQDLGGATLDYKNAFEVKPPADHIRFWKELSRLLPPSAVLYFEGVSLNVRVSGFFRAHEGPRELRIRRGTIAPRPETYHVLLTEELIQQLIEFFKSMCINEICDHFHAYANDNVLLEWHDAFHKDPLLLSSRIPEEKIRDFCSELGCSYEKLEVHNS